MTDSESFYGGIPVWAKKLYESFVETVKIKHFEKERKLTNMPLSAPQK